MLIIDREVSQGVVAHFPDHIIPVFERMVQFAQEGFSLLKEARQRLHDFPER